MRTLAKILNALFVALITLGLLVSLPENFQRGLISLLGLFMAFSLLVTPSAMAVFALSGKSEGNPRAAYFWNLSIFLMLLLMAAVVFAKFGWQGAVFIATSLLPGFNAFLIRKLILKEQVEVELQKHESEIQPLNNEVIVFRFAVVSAAIVFFVSIGGWHHYHEQARDLDQMAGQLRDPAQFIKLSAGEREALREVLPDLLHGYRRNSEIADQLLLASWAIPSGIYFLFLSGRWAILGRIRPLFPSNKSKRPVA